MRKMYKLLREYLLAFVHLFFPRYCAVCSHILEQGEEFICTKCRWDMPLTNFWKESDNPMKARLSDLFAIENATALFFFHKDSGHQRLIHKLKYENRSRISYELGEWLGDELKNSGLYNDIDYIVPVPLHPLRLLSRGYNQSEYLARGISRSTGIKISSGNLIRKVYNSSQTHYSQSERWDNVSGVFTLRNPSKFQGKHILIVDDVVTTGATIESCAHSINMAVDFCRISVASIATSSKDTFGKS